MKKFLYSLLFLFAGLGFLPSRAEVLFYKSNEASLSAQEYDILYDIQLKNQFPMSTLVGNCPDNEIKAMQQEVDKQLPGQTIIVAFIPTTLYELLFLSFLYEKKDAIEDITHGLVFYGNEQYWRTEKLTNANGLCYTPKNVHSNHINQLSGLKNCFGMFNDYTINFLRKHGISLTPEIKAEKLLSDKNLIYTANRFFDGRTSILSGILERVTSHEYHAHKKDEFLLYRGTDVIEESSEGNQSLSFGNSLFAGSVFESGIVGACAYSYWRLKDYGYILPISKKKFVEYNDLFDIPPITTIAGVLGEGEYFHARSKIIRPIKGYTDTVRGFGQPYAQDILDLRFYQIPDKTDCYEQIFSYIQKHHIPVTYNDKRTISKPMHAAKATGVLRSMKLVA